MKEKLLALAPLAVLFASAVAQERPQELHNQSEYGVLLKPPHQNPAPLTEAEIAKALEKELFMKANGIKAAGYANLSYLCDVNGFTRNGLLFARAAARLAPDNVDYKARLKYMRQGGIYGASSYGQPDWNDRLIELGLQPLQIKTPKPYNGPIEAIP